VVVDDVALPLGRLRVRERGSDGGHNGLHSLILALGSDEFARVRIGVGIEPPPELELAAFVLEEFLPDELPRVQEVVGLAADAVACLLQEGAAAAMNRFNGRRV
jgi:PTH1 family peptidyl-tRNA hydrolase